MNFISHDEFFARLPKDRQVCITAKTNKLKQAYQLSQLRQHAKLSQQALADKMGVSQANISKIEHGGDVQSLGSTLSICATMADGQVVTIM